MAATRSPLRRSAWKSQRRISEKSVAGTGTDKAKKCTKSKSASLGRSAQPRVVAQDGEQVATKGAGEARQRVHQPQRSAGAVPLATTRHASSEMLEEPIEYVTDTLFEALPAGGVIAEFEAEAIPGEDRRRAARSSVTAPAGLPPYLASLYETPLLDKEQEAFLFRKMNYLKFQAERLRDVPARRRRPAARRQIEGLLARADNVRNQIMQANLRLVVSIAKKFADGVNTFEELVSEGNMPLFRAVELFDAGKGFRFSTYATWAIRNHLQRFLADRHKHRQRFIANDEYVATWSADERTSVTESEARFKRQRHLVSQVLNVLSEREQHIVEARYGLNDSRQAYTLAEIGRDLGISKERVRQLATVALEKVQKLVTDAQIDSAGGV